jgi:hypothetical protein
MMYTLLAYRLRKRASSIAASPPPTTPTGRFLRGVEERDMVQCSSPVSSFRVI